MYKVMPTDINSVGELYCEFGDYWCCSDILFSLLRILANFFGEYLASITSRMWPFTKNDMLNINLH